jgi:hypothetical protein
MNVTLVLTTPDEPTPHTLTFDRVESVRYTSDSDMLDMIPGVRIMQPGLVHRFDLRCVLDVLVTR